MLAPPIETPRLILKPLDVAAARGPYQSWMRDADLLRYMEVRHDPPDAARLACYIGNMNASNSELLLGIFPRHQADAHIGNIKLGPIAKYHRSAYIGILIGDRASWNQGFATEAIRALTGYAFAELAMRRVKAGCYMDNASSLRAFAKAGFREIARIPQERLCDGVWQDEIVLAMDEQAAAGANTAVKVSFKA